MTPRVLGLMVVVALLAGCGCTDDPCNADLNLVIEADSSELARDHRILITYGSAPRVEVQVDCRGSAREAACDTGLHRAALPDNDVRQPDNADVRITFTGEEAQPLLFERAPVIRTPASNSEDLCDACDDLTVRVSL